MKHMICISLCVALFLTGCNNQPKQVPSSRETSESAVESVSIPISMEQMTAKIDSLAKVYNLVKRHTDGSPYYRHKSTMESESKIKTYTYITVLPEISQIGLVLSLRYASNNWLIIDSYEFNVDGKVFSIVPTKEVTRDESGDELRESYSLVVSARQAPDWREASVPSKLAISQSISVDDTESKRRDVVSYDCEVSSTS